VEKRRRAAGRFECRSLMVGGGVSANTAVRAGVAALGAELGLPVHVPAMRYCTDNGAMIAGMGWELLRSGRVADLGLETVATV
jgi:N6-L-threonylcarbamoyladenine synthase